MEEEIKKNEKDSLDIKSLSFTELKNKLLENKEEPLSYDIWNQLIKLENSKENKEMKKDLKEVINNEEHESYKIFFNFNEYNTYYSAFIMYDLYLILESDKKKLIKNKLWKREHFINIKDSKYYSEENYNLIQRIGKNYYIYYLIKIYKFYINFKNLKNEHLYQNLINYIFICFYCILEELTITNNYIKNFNQETSNGENFNNMSSIFTTLIDSYKNIINEITEIIINNQNIIKSLINNILEIDDFKKYFNFILFDGILRNNFSMISELVKNFLINIYNNFKQIKESDIDNKDDNTDNNYLYNFYFFIIEKYFDNFTKNVLNNLKEIRPDIDEDNNFYDKFRNNYEKNIINFFSLVEESLKYLYILNLNEKLLKKLVENFNDKIMEKIYTVTIKKYEFDPYYYDLFYGGLCCLIFRMIIELNSNTKRKNFNNIELDLNYNKEPLKNFLFNKIIFSQNIQKKNSSTMNDYLDGKYFKIKSKYSSDNANNLFLLLIIKDFNKNKEINNSDENLIINYLSKLNDIHKLNFWIGNTISSWKFNHKEKIKTNKYVGLKNLGNTCYMNSLLQILYSITPFRECILNCSCKDPKNNSLFELKKIFYSLQYLDIQYYSPDSFPKNFEGQPLNIMEQTDIDEFFAKLMDKLESRLKGTNNENIIKYFFQGKQNDNLNFEGNCPHKRTNINNFYSIQIQVKDHKNIYESLDEFIKGEKMDGDNCIFCEKCNKKIPAIKNLDFKTLPRVLMIVLKRFEFDYSKMTRYKLNDYFEFPLELDMNKYTNDYINNKNTNINNKYFLRGVVIHSGSCEMGHYYSIIKNMDSKNEDWFLYNDAIVTKFDINKLKEEAFGDKVIDNKNTNNKKEDKNDNKKDNNKDNNNNDKMEKKENNDVNKDKNKNEDKGEDKDGDRAQNKDNNDKDDNDISFDENYEFDIYGNKKKKNNNKENNFNTTKTTFNTNNNNAITNNINNNNNFYFRKMGKSAYLLFYEKIDKNNCENFDKIEAINPFLFGSKKDYRKKISSSIFVFNERINFSKKIEDKLIIESINDEMYNYYLLKKIFSDEYHHFLLAFYVNLLNYYYSDYDSLISKIKHKCGTPFKYCLNFKDNIYTDIDYFTPRKEKNSNLFYYLTNKKLIFFEINEIKNKDENYTKERILNLFQNLIVFFFNIKIRTINKKLFGGYVDLIKFLINNFDNCCEYFLEEFCNYNVLVEYFVNCPLYDIKKLIVGIINCAMINSMMTFRKKQKKEIIRKQSDKEEKDEVFKILGKCSKKTNKFNYYNIINENISSDRKMNSGSKKIKELNNITVEINSDDKSEQNNNIENEYLPKVMIKFINNIISLIYTIGITNISDNKFLFFILYKFSIISSKTKEYLIKVIPLLDLMNIKMNPTLEKQIDSGKNIDIQKFFKKADHDILNIKSNNEKANIIGDKGGLYNYENYLYMLYYNLLTYDDYQNSSVFSFDSSDFIFRLFYEIINRQECYVLAHLLNTKCLNNINRENIVINLISDILDRVDYKEEVNYKLNKVNYKNSNITSVQEYKNKYDIDPRNILLILKLFILHKDNNGEYYRHRVETGLTKLFELLSKYKRYYNFCILLIDFIIDLFLNNNILIKEYVGQFKKELKNINDWIDEHKESPKYKRIEGLDMYRDDNVNYNDPNITEQQKKEFYEKEKNLYIDRTNKLKIIIKQKKNENENLDIKDINISEFIFQDNDEILYNGKHAVVIKHLNEMIKIKFDKDIINKKENDEKGKDGNNNSQNGIESKMWVNIEDEKILINKLFT